MYIYGTAQNAMDAQYVRSFCTINIRYSGYIIMCVVYCMLCSMQETNNKVMKHKRIKKIFTNLHKDYIKLSKGAI